MIIDFPTTISIDAPIDIIASNLEDSLNEVIMDTLYDYNEVISTLSTEEYDRFLKDNLPSIKLAVLNKLKENL